MHPAFRSRAILEQLSAAAEPARDSKTSTLVEVVTADRSSRHERVLRVATNAALRFSKELASWRSGADDVLEVPEGAGGSRRDLTVLGKRAGRTTLTVFFGDASVEQFVFTVGA
jgi:hypothetical protein